MIKFYAWEESFRAAVMAARNQEARILRRTALWQVGVWGVFWLEEGFSSRQGGKQFGASGTQLRCAAAALGSRDAPKAEWLCPSEVKQK